MPVPVLMRRARLRLGLSQQELAQRTELSQPSISNYERGISVPQADQWEVISKVLKIPFAPLIQATASPQASDGSAEQVECRRRLLNTLSELPLEVEVLDQPLDGGGGDLGFAISLGTHLYIVWLDAIGSGYRAMPSAAALAACAYGALRLPGAGAPRPEDIVDSVVRYARLVLDELPAVGVVSIERGTRHMIQCRLGLPAPFLGGSGWMGKPSGPGGAHVGERAAKPGEILLLATDGVANLPTKGERTLWQTSELRSILMHSGNPHMVIDALARRLPSAKTSLDDALALAVQL